MIAAIDIHYKMDGSATAGAVIFYDFSDDREYRTYIKHIQGVEDYVPGQFYRRELPCITAILGIIEEEIDTVIIDGYVNLGEGPGMGMHLWNTLNGEKTIIGVAKTEFRGSNAVKVFRGDSRQPLYVTSVWIEPLRAAGCIKCMHGQFRIPALLKQADSLSRYGK